MSNAIISFRRILLSLSCTLLRPVICVLAITMLVAQFTEVTSNSEILPLTSFIVLLSFSALAFNWCRVPPAFSSESALLIVYRTGIDLFIASLLALVSTFFAWMLTIQSGFPRFLTIAIIVLHWIFLFLALLLFVLAVLSLVAIVKQLHD